MIKYTHELQYGDVIRVAQRLRTVQSCTVLPGENECRIELMPHLNMPNTLTRPAEETWMVHTDGYETTTPARQQVQSVRTGSLALIQQSPEPRDALYALLRRANQDVLQILAQQGLESEGDFQVEVTVRTIARPAQD